jgi:hypothetical protein
VEQNKDDKESVEKLDKVEEIELIQENKEVIESSDKKNIYEEMVDSEVIITEVIETNEGCNCNEIAITKEEEIIDESEEIEVVEETINELEITEEDEEYIKEIKIKRGKSIIAIDVYTKEPQVFKTHKDCSKKLRIPVEYIQENLKYGYTDYLGEAIKYLSKELDLSEEEDINYLENIKTPSQILTSLNSKIFTIKMSDDKRDEILCNEKIEPIKMHYVFECIDEEYDDYFKKYKSIIKRGGKKKIELVDKKGEVIEIFKSLDECATFINKEKNEVVDMLKYKETKVGRNEIRYSLRNI